ncbi:MAG: hypothetical protein LBR15_07790 [Methanobrevibacter sp.]|jgi:hypothetical protein|nr:hypothetical protein [Candidatus Methanovirga australis]
MNAKIILSLATLGILMISSLGNVVAIDIRTTDSQIVEMRSDAYPTIRYETWNSSNGMYRDFKTEFLSLKQFNQLKNTNSIEIGNNGNPICKANGIDYYYWHIVKPISV